MKMVEKLREAEREYRITPYADFRLKRKFQDVSK